MQNDLNAISVDNEDSNQPMGKTYAVEKKMLNGDWHDGMIHGILFVPDLEMTLFSVGKANDRGMKEIFDNACVVITKKETSPQK